MLVFSNPSPIEISEDDEQITIEIDPILSDISEPIEVEILTADSTALSTSFLESNVGVDFNSIDNLTTIIDPDNPDTLTFTLNITDDAIAEPNEDFVFQIISVEDEVLLGTATITIIDDEIAPESGLIVEGLPPQITVDNVEQLEGNTDNTTFEFTVSLSQPSIETVTVDYLTTDGTAESGDLFAGSILIDPADYIPTNGTLEFAPGETSKTIEVKVLADTEFFTDETPDETFFINLSNANNADIEQFVGAGIILDDDFKTETAENLTFLQIDNQEFVEGNIGEDTEQNILVSLADADGEAVIATEDINFSFATVDVTTSADLDYEFIESEAATIIAGESNTEISITTIGDGQTEIDETLLVILSDLDTNLAQFDSGESELTAEIVILNDDAVSDNDLTEPNVSNLDIDFDGNTVFRFFDSQAGAYFYTASEVEKDFVAENLDNFILEDFSFASVNPDGSDEEVDVFRFFNPTTGGYFYTASETEREIVGENLDEFVFEGIAFAAFDSETASSIPVYRFFETNAGVHFYTADEAEKTLIEDNLPNFDFEGIAFYGLPVETDTI